MRRRAPCRAGLAVAWLLMAACASKPKGAPIDVPLRPPPRPANELLEQLRAPDAQGRAAAAWSLAGAGTVDAAAIQALRAALDDESRPVREAATWALAHVKGPGWDSKELSDSPPKAVTLTHPSYPSEAFNKKLQGTVTVELLIDELGKVSHAEVRGSNPGLDEAALACVRDWQFKPAQRKGKAVPAFATSPVTFRIY